MHTDPINGNFRQELVFSKATENSENVLKNSSLISWPLKDVLNVQQKIWNFEHFLHFCVSNWRTFMLLVIPKTISDLFTFKHVGISLFCLKDSSELLFWCFSLEHDRKVLIFHSFLQGLQINSVLYQMEMEYINRNHLDCGKGTGVFCLRFHSLE